MVWSEPAVAVGKRFGVTSTTIKNHCERRGIPTPESGFWTKVQRGTVEHPHGELPEKERIRFQLRTKQTPAPKDDYILQRHRCEGSPAPTVAWLVGSAPKSKAGTGNKSDTSSVN